MTKALPADPALAAAIQQLRHQAGLTQEDLAFASGLTIASVSRVECAITNPNWTTIRCLTTGLGITLHQLTTTIEAQEDASPPVRHHTPRTLRPTSTPDLSASNTAPPAPSHTTR
jgi:transcriptional regulator with XRE-family HTH domain